MPSIREDSKSSSLSSVGEDLEVDVVGAEDEEEGKF